MLSVNPPKKVINYMGKKMKKIEDYRRFCFSCQIVIFNAPHAHTIPFNGISSSLPSSFPFGWSFHTINHLLTCSPLVFWVLYQLSGLKPKKLQLSKLLPCQPDGAGPYCIE
jgi:hypothetical protein